MSRKTFKEKKKQSDLRLKNFISNRVSRIGEHPIEKITFIKANGTRVVQNINDKFLKDKTSKKIEQDIFAISKDMNANYLIM